MRALQDEQLLSRRAAHGAVLLPAGAGHAGPGAALRASPSTAACCDWRAPSGWASSSPTRCPSVVAVLMWGYLYGRLRPVRPARATRSQLPIPDFLSRDLALASLANVVTWEYTGYNMIILYAALRAIPHELYEAAAVDGAERLRGSPGASRSRSFGRRSCSRVLFSVIGSFQLFNEPQSCCSASRRPSSTAPTRPTCTPTPSPSPASRSTTRRRSRSCSGSSSSSSPTPSWSPRTAGAGADERGGRGRHRAPRDSRASAAGPTELHPPGRHARDPGVLPAAAVLAGHRLDEVDAATCSRPSGCGSPTTSQLVTNIRATLTYDDGVYLRLDAQHPPVRRRGSAGGAALLATAGGYGFAKFRFPGNRALLRLVLGAIMVPTTALAIPTYLLFAKVGLVNTPWAIILPVAGQPVRPLPHAGLRRRTPCRTAASRPARIDGAGEFRIFFADRAAAAGARHGDRAAVHPRRDLEQLLPAAHHAERPRPRTRSRSGSRPGPRRRGAAAARTATCSRW